MKKKVLLFVAAVSLLMAACSQKAATGYTITGSAEGSADGDSVFLCEMQGFFAMIPVDTTVVRDGKFAFTGEAEGAALRFIVPIHDGQPLGTAMFVLENADIHVAVKPEGQESIIEGGPSQKIFEEYLAGENKLGEQMNEPWQLANDSTASDAVRQSAQQVVDSLDQVMANYRKQFIISHVPSAASDMLLGYCLSGFQEQDLEEILTLLGEKQPQYPVYKAIMSERHAMEATAIGAQYTDLQLNDPDGKAMKLSDYVGKSKYVLVDFWASWCGPCRAEMPTVVKAYDTYHDKGFEVIGVSLDNNGAAWKKAIGQLQMPWPQMSDLKGWDSEAAALYGVKAIPANILLDQQGRIVAKDLRGDDLLNKLAELL